MLKTVRPWTCPFCPLLCDRFDVGLDGPVLALKDGHCPKSEAGLAHFPSTPQPAPTMVGGVPCDEATAVAEAARLLAASRQPLFGGMATDVAGARALFALAASRGAIADAAHGEALMAGVQALQDRGGYSTTLAEVRERCDLMVVVGEWPTPRYPLFFARTGFLESDPRLVLLPADELALLAAQVEGRLPATALSERLRHAQYAVLVYEAARLAPHAALAIEMLQRVVATLNRSTRAAAFGLGGSDGAATANAVFTWLSGLPLRSRAGPHGLEHEPWRFDARRLLADRACDLLLWVSSYGPEPACPDTTGIPRIVIGHPAHAATAAEVFIPVATPGIGAGGHLFRVDGSVMLPLHAVRPDGLPTVAAVVNRIRCTA